MVARILFPTHLRAAASSAAQSGRFCEQSRLLIAPALAAQLCGFYAVEELPAASLERVERSSAWFHLRVVH